ncbi:MAG TPA: NUDIX domain-containing protein [Candidatus Paceibacterota bacterium]|nr:NUDIX domain-containing protein [Candidatus Paceibacterota bacterium]
MILQVGVKALLRNTEGRVLLLKRSSRYGVVEGSWDIPGGRIDVGTSLMENLSREIHEETGLTAVSHPKLIAAQDLLPKENMPNHVVRLTYVAEVSGEPVLDGTEHTEYRWVSFDELATLPNLDAYLAKLVSEGVITADSWN